MLDLWGTSGHLGNGLQHLDALEVTAVEPAKVRLTSLGGLPVDELDHGLNPLGIAKTIQSALICRVYLCTAIVAFEGVTLRTDTVGNSREFCADLAGDSGDAPGVAGHFAGV